MLVDGVPMYRHYPDDLVDAFQRRIEAEYGEYAACGFDAPSLLRAMDRQGIERCFLYPSLGLGVLAIDGQDPRLAAAIARAYNDWLAGYCDIAPPRLNPVAVVTLHDPADARAEVRRAARGLGMRAVTIRPNPIRGRAVGHGDFEPFWAVCEDAGMAVGIHEGCHTRLPAAGADRFTSHFAMHTCCHPMEQMMAFVSLADSGTLERHPSLRVAFLEAGCGWVPYLLWRMDRLEYPHWGFQVPQVKRPPSEYFRRQCYVSVEGCEPYLVEAARLIGDDRLLFASDFPHPDHAFAEEITDLQASGLSPAVQRRVLGDNALAFYRVGA